mmetsp:Transcript_2962/g.7578  ORF Transcript_2962/g.7578 Transcript_2962/m.7578 type:complete len:251 (+) Transcript_2962:514-1266(+)
MVRAGCIQVCPDDLSKRVEYKELAHETTPQPTVVVGILQKRVGGLLHWKVQAVNESKAPLQAGLPPLNQRCPFAHLLLSRPAHPRLRHGFEGHCQHVDPVPEIPGQGCWSPCEDELEADSPGDHVHVGQSESQHVTGAHGALPPSLFICPSLSPFPHAAQHWPKLVVEDLEGTAGKSRHLQVRHVVLRIPHCSPSRIGALHQGGVCEVVPPANAVGCHSGQEEQQNQAAPACRYAEVALRRRKSGSCEQE